MELEEELKVVGNSLKSLEVSEEKVNLFSYYFTLFYFILCQYFFIINFYNFISV